MKYTLLDMVQTILAEMDSDEVNSINDNAESEQVSRIIRTVYFDIVARAKLPENFTLFSLEASGTSTKPTLMTKPTTANTVEWIKYDAIADGETASNYKELKFKPIDEMMGFLHALNTDEDNVLSFSHTIGTSSISFPYRDDKAPEYYTTFDDNTIIFDSFDADVDANLQKTKTLCYGLVGETFSLSDSYQPPLDDQQYALLLNQSIARAWFSMKQMEHTKADREARRHWVSLQKDKRNIKGWNDYYHNLPNYGRK
jgi:hypothetical protein